MISKRPISALALVLAAALLPNLAFAITFDGLVTKFRGWLNLVIPIVIGLGLVYFFWGLANFIANSGDEKGREEGKSKMIWGTLALFVMVSIWGIIGLFNESLTVNQGGTFEPPKF